MTDKIAIVDADALIALVLEKDSNYKKAISVASKLSEDNVELIFPSTVFPEAITSLTRALNQPQKAHLLNKKIQEGIFNIEYIDQTILNRASKIFENSKSKKNTMFDAIVAATAEELGTKTIFSFDNWYQKLGFKLA